MGRTRIVVRVEGLEPRDLLSVIPIILQQSHPRTPPPTLGQLSAEMAGGGGGAGGGSGSSGSGGGTGNASTNEFIVPPANGTPTPHERKREQFTFKFSGKFVEGAPRFSNQSSLIYIKGVGASTYFRHGDVQVGIVVPKDPTLPASGNATSYDRNNNTNAAFSFDLTGVPGAVDKFGRPTQFSTVTDINTSAGIFGESTSSGMLTIRYLPGGEQHPGFFEGKALVSIKGMAYTLGTTGNLAVLGTQNTTDPNKIAF